MDTPPKILCGICDAQQITKSADFWCPECDDGLCTECKTHHSFSKSSRHHDVISTEDFRKLPTGISNIVHHCTEHEKKLQMYCPHHDQLCCLLCISTSHKDCTGMLPIEEIAKTSKSSGLLESLQSSLEGMKNNFDNIVQDRQKNLTKIKEQRQNIYDVVKRLRKRINSHLDKVEKEINEQLCTAECDMNIKIEELLKELQEKSERIAVLQTNMSCLQNHASDLQSFIGSKNLEKEVKSEETYMQSLTKDDRLKQFSLKYAQSEVIEDLLQNIKTFGWISNESCPPTVVIKLKKFKQAQMITASVNPEPVKDMSNKSTDNFGPSAYVNKAIKVDPRPCSVCFTIGTFQCSRCKTPYCSQKCQTSDWNEHKQFCKDLRADDDQVESLLKTNNN